MQTERASFSALLPRAENVLARTFGRTVRLDLNEILKQGNRSYVLRCAVTSDDASLPTSVILKQIKQQSDRGYDDWAGVQFLSDVKSDPPFVPRFLGGDPEAGFFIMEDLGPGHTLEDLLLGTDRAAAEEALLGLAAIAGRMHVATNGREDEYGQIRASIGPMTTCIRAWNASNLREGLSVVGQAFQAVDVQPGRGFDEECARVARTLETPGAWLVYTHGDMAPSNNHYRTALPRLLDFEYGAFRHALYDVIFWRIICPFPAAIALRMDDIYRRAVASAIPEAARESTFYSALARLCAYDLCINLTWHFQHAIEHDRPWAGDFTVRQALLYKLDVFSTVTENTGQLEALGESMGKLEERLKALWADAVGKAYVWPVFRTMEP
jgi:hypothetical protein